MKDVYSRSSDKNEKNISMKNLEKIIKLLIKFNELKKNRKRGKNDFMLIDLNPKEERLAIRRNFDEIVDINNYL